jgi:UDP-glucose 4-epimerase
MSAMRCLVIGGGGFIGSHVVDALVRNGNEVTVFDRPNISLENLCDSIDDVKIIQGDLCNPVDIEDSIREKDVIYHFAATTLPGPSNQNPLYDIETNLVSTLGILENAVKNDVKKIIFASSGGTVYGIPQSLPITEDHPTEPTCSYGITKLAIEKYLFLYNHLHDLNYIVLRFGNPYGQRQRTENIQGVIPVFLWKLNNNEIIDIWGDGTVSRDYFHISDLVDAVLKATHSSFSHDIFNIASGNALSLLDILSIMEKVTGIHPQLRFLPGRKLDVPVNCLDIGKARRLLKWQPTVSLEDGIQKTWEWIKTHL